MEIRTIMEKQRKFFASHVTFDTEYRISMLKKLRVTIGKYEAEIHKALKEDLGKDTMEAYMCETGMTISEISRQIKNLKKWSRTKLPDPILQEYLCCIYVFCSPSLITPILLKIGYK